MAESKAKVEKATLEILEDDDEFDKLWKVMTKDEYELSFKNNLQNRQMGKMKYEWWKDIGENGSELDI